MTRMALVLSLSLTMPGLLASSPASALAGLRYGGSHGPSAGNAGNGGTAHGAAGGTSQGMPAFRGGLFSAMSGE